MPVTSPAPKRSVRKTPTNRKPAKVKAWQWPLLAEINKGFSPSWWANYRSLVARREAETIAPDELRELTALTDTLEEMNARRISCFASASRSLGVPLEELMRRMKLNPKPV